MPRQRKLVITVFVVAIVLTALLGVVPLVIKAITGPGVKTEGLDASHADPASTQLDGTWQIVPGSDLNTSAVGFTFPEILPGDRRVTSGTTHEVSGFVVVKDQELIDGSVVVDMAKVATDNKRRDINVRTKIFETDTYPESTFTVDKPVDLSKVPADGTVGHVELTGTLTIRDQSRKVTAIFDVLRDDDQIVISSDIPIKREDYGVAAPEFVAAKIAEEGEINIRLAFEKGK